MFEARREAPMPCNKLVLVVDDDIAIRNAICDLLQDEGYGTISAENGLVALTRLKDSDEPCVILLDLMMPLMDGISFRKEQQRDPSLASIPVVVVSAGQDAREVAGALAAADFIPKPLSVPRLIHTLERLC
jgi:CheY-like chemotaxis protein